jgi:putative MATE family efflux protein
MLIDLKKDREFFKNLLILAIPIILQNLIGASLNLLDNLMIGSLGENAIASTGIANQYYMLYYNSTNGIVMGSGIFMAQYWGKKDVKSIYKFMGISLLFSLFTAFLFVIGGVFFSENIMGIFTKEKIVSDLGKNYLAAVAPSYIFTSISLTYAMALRSAGYTKIPMYASLIGLIFNGVLNYIFIFGKLGIPALGVTGAALGTTVARFMEMSFILHTIYVRDKNIIAGKLSEMFVFTKDLITKFIKTATPVVFNDVMWIGGITVYFIAYSKLGTNATATMQISNTINNAFNIFAIGIAIASSIVIGNKIGAGEEKEAKEVAIKINIFGIALGVLVGVVFFIASPFIPLMFKITPETKANVITVLRIMSVLVPVRFFGIVQIIGVLRGGGDVVYAILVELIAVWGIGVPLSFIGAVYLNYPITIVYALTCLEEPFKMISTIPRLLSGKWIRNLVK